LLDGAEIMFLRKDLSLPKATNETFVWLVIEIKLGSFFQDIEMDVANNELELCLVVAGIKLQYD